MKKQKYLYIVFCLWLLLCVRSVCQESEDDEEEEEESIYDILNKEFRKKITDEPEKYLHSWILFLQKMIKGKHTIRDRVKLMYKGFALKDADFADKIELMFILNVFFEEDFFIAKTLVKKYKDEIFEEIDINEKEKVPARKVSEFLSKLLRTWLKYLKEEDKRQKRMNEL
jgi:hypothetical protein